MKRILLIILLIICSSCTQQGFENIKIQNLASQNIYIEARERSICNVDNSKKVQEFCQQKDVEKFLKYEGDVSKSFGLSNWSIRWRWHSPKLDKKNNFSDLDSIKIFYKSKSCLIFKYDRYDDKTLGTLYQESTKTGGILVLTNNGLELLTKDQYESRKGKYTINDSNVKCIKE